MGSSKDSDNELAYGICSLSVVAMRRKPDDHSEMISQLLFGECFQVLRRIGKRWVKISCLSDSLIAWVALNQVTLFSKANCDKHLENTGFSLDHIQSAMSDNHAIPIPIGASLPNFDGISFRVSGHKYSVSGHTIRPGQLNLTPELVIKIARKFIHTPYLKGGRTPFGIDADGLTQMIFKLIGIPIPRFAEEQAEMGEIVDFASHADTGDLAFFMNESGQIVHTGILIDKLTILHAYGKVRIDTLDHQGIYNRETRRYTHKLRIIKRLIHSETSDKVVL